MCKHLPEGVYLGMHEFLVPLNIMTSVSNLVAEVSFSLSHEQNVHIKKKSALFG